MLNVLPWGRPALTELYQKISGKNQPQRGVPINAEVIADLEWLKMVIPQAVGIQFDKIGLWADHEADMVLWTDASLHTTLSFMYANKGFVYVLQPPPPGRKIDIFFLELVAIMSAIHHPRTLSQPPCHLLVWMDSLDAVGVLNSLHATESLHNAPLLAIAQAILHTGIDL